MRAYSFKDDPRISAWEREQLRDFCSSLEGNVIELVRGFGLKVLDEELLPYERGFLERAPSHGSASGWVIKLNQADYPETKNFTVAHELGHFLLHKACLAELDQIDGRMNRDTLGGVELFSYLDKRDPIREAEANTFASNLLMPPNLFKPAFLRLGGDVGELAKLFFVSVGAVHKRKRELGL